MSRWFRHYAGMMSDPKFGGVARFCKRSRAEVLFVFGCLLESASEYDSAVYSWDADAIAELLSIETAEAQSIHDALEAKGLISGGRIAAWDRRQFKSDDSSERVKAHRQRQKEAEEQRRNANETARNGDVTPPETEAETDTPTSVAKAPEVSIKPIEKSPRKSRLGPTKEAFARFWAEYPNKVGKLAAEKAYPKAWQRQFDEDPDVDADEAILAGLRGCMERWAPEFIPNPLTFLNQGRWMDQPKDDLPDSTGPPKLDLAKIDADRARIRAMYETEDTAA